MKKNFLRILLFAVVTLFATSTLGNEIVKLDTPMPLCPPWCSTSR
jgi:hypothetical protein